MFTQLTVGGALVLVAALVGGAWALASKKSNDCCFPGSDCCYPGSPCCADCCSPGSPCCYPGSPCCDDSPKAKPSDTGAKAVDCCANPTCPPDCPPYCRDGDKVKAATKPASGAKCEGGKCTTNCTID